MPLQECNRENHELIFQFGNLSQVCESASGATLVKCCRNLFQPTVHLEDAVVLVISFIHEQDVVSKFTAG